MVNDWIQKVKKREKVKIIPSFLAWTAFWIMELLAERRDRGETVLEVARGTKMN